MAPFDWNRRVLELLGQIVEKLSGVLAVNGIQFSLAYTPSEHSEGLLFWDTASKTLGLMMPGGYVVLQIGQEIYVRAKNDEGSDVVNGDIGYISGGEGVVPKMKLAQNDDDTAGKTIAIATADIAKNNIGYWTSTGLVRGDEDQPIDTSSYPAGTMLWLDETKGKWTGTHPVPPKRRVSVAKVIRSHSSEGVLYVDIRERHRTFNAEQIEGYPLPNETLVRHYFPGRDEYVNQAWIFADGVPVSPGSYTLRVRKNGVTDMLATTAYDMTGISALTRTELTMATTEADRVLGTSDFVTAELASDNDDLSGFGAVYVVLSTVR